MNESEFIYKFKTVTRKEQTFLVSLIIALGVVFISLSLLYYAGYFQVKEYDLVSNMFIIFLNGYVLYRLYECMVIRYKIRTGKLTISNREFLKKVSELEKYNNLKILKNNNHFIVIRTDSLISSGKEVFLLLKDDRVLFNARPLNATGIMDGLFVNSLPKELKSWIEED